MTSERTCTLIVTSNYNLGIMEAKLDEFRRGCTLSMLKKETQSFCVIK